MGAEGAKNKSDTISLFQSSFSFDPKIYAGPQQFSRESFLSPELGEYKIIMKMSKIKNYEIMNAYFTSLNGGGVQFV